MIQYHVYPGGKKRILTFSYDDGSLGDERLVGIFNKYGVKGTFHLNGGNYANIGSDDAEKLRARYSGHEVSCHTLLHGWPARMPPQSLVCEIMEDRRILENIFGCPITGMSYPGGSFSEDVTHTLVACGIVYSRTTRSTGGFVLPENFLTWHPSCHHKDAEPLAERFLATLDSEWTSPLFYIWGHSHEFRSEDDWMYIESLVERLADNEKIWYATNMDIYNYMQAQKMLVISVDEKVFSNPTATDVWVEKNKTQIIKIPAGRTVVI